MNISYRVIWNATIGKWVVASELAKTNGKSSTRKKGAVTLCVAASLLALPIQFAAAQTSPEEPVCDSSDLNPSSECVAQLSSANGAFAGFASSAFAMPTAAAMLDDTYIKVNPLAGGTGATASGNGAIAIGTNSVSTGNGDIAVGQDSVAKGGGINATAIGTFASAQGQGAAAIGGRAAANGDRSVAIGRFSASSAVDSTAIGSYATVNAGATNAIALGANSVADRSNVISIGAAGNERSIVNVAAGVQNTDAVNMSQLNATNTRMTTAEGKITAAQGDIGTLQGNVSGLDSRMTLNEGSITNLETSINNVTTQLNKGTIGLLQQASAGAKLTVGANTDGSSVDFAGTAGARTLTNVANGVADSDAVNMSQLNATNARVDATETTMLDLDGRVLGAETSIDTLKSDVSGLDTRLGTAEGALSTAQGNIGALQGNVSSLDSRMTLNEGSITNLETSINNVTTQLNKGTIGLLQQASAGAKLTVGANTDGSSVDFAGTAGARALTNVANGVADSDAVNMSQLNATNARVDATETTMLDLDGRVLGAETSIDTLKSDVSGLDTRLGTAEGALSTAQGDIGTLKDNVSGLDSRMTLNEGSITNLETSINNVTTQLNNGSVGLVQQASAGAKLTVGAGADGGSVDFGGTAGARTLTNVANGVADSDAVNMSQLNATNARVDATETTMLDLDGRMLGAETSIDTLKGDVSGLDTRVVTAEGKITTVQGDVTLLDGRMGVAEGTINTLQTSVDTVTAQLNGGTVGLVQQAGAGASLTVGAGKDGLAVDFAGTAGARTLKNVKAGEEDGDAVNMSQLNDTNARVDAADTAITGLGTRMDTAEGSIGMLQGDVVGLGTRMDVAETSISAVQSSISNVTNQLASGEIGLVQQAGAGNKLTVGAALDGADVDFADKDNNTRTLKNVTAGSADTDAVNVSQLRASGLVDASGAAQVALTYDSPSFASMTLRGANGTVINNVAAGAVAQGSMQAVNGGQLYAMQQGLQTQVDQLGANVTTLGSNVQTQMDQLNNNYITLGDTVQSQYEQLTANVTTLQNNVQSQFDAADDLASSLNSRLSSMEQDLAGRQYGGSGSGEGSAQLGAGANASGNNSTAVGGDAKASGNQSTAMGSGAVASGNSSTALGNGASATANNAVALGAGSVADRDNTVSMGSVGNERQVTNVAAGTQRTDAANWGQVQDAVGGVQDWANNKFHEVNRHVNAVGAMGAAYGQMALSAQGINTANKVGVGVGSMKGKAAIAVGYSRQLAPNVNLSFGGSASGNDASVGAGMSMGW